MVRAGGGAVPGRGDDVQVETRWSEEERCSEKTGGERYLKRGGREDGRRKGEML